MNIKRVYDDFIYRMNALGTNKNQYVGLPQFVALINKAALHWAEARIKVAEEQLTRVDEVQQLLEDFESGPIGKKENHYRIPLPENYFHRSRLYAKVEGCDGLVYGKFVEEGNVNTLLQGAFTSPSAAWEETLVTIFKNQLRVYFKDFSLSKIYLKYYRHPKPVDIEGYTIDGVTSTNKDLEFDGVNAQEIIDLAVQIASGDTADTTRYQTISRHIQENN